MRRRMIPLVLLAFIPGAGPVLAVEWPAAAPPRAAWPVADAPPAPAPARPGALRSAERPARPRSPVIRFASLGGGSPLDTPPPTIPAPDRDPAPAAAPPASVAPSKVSPGVYASPQTPAPGAAYQPAPAASWPVTVYQPAATGQPVITVSGPPGGYRWTASIPQIAPATYTLDQPVAGYVYASAPAVSYYPSVRRGPLRALGAALFRPRPAAGYGYAYGVASGSVCGPGGCAVGP